MKSLELDIGRMLKAFVLTCFCLLLIVPTISLQAQTPEPTPIPLRPSSQELQALDSIAKHLEEMSASSDTTANASTLILGGAFFVLMLVILIIVVWIARGGLNRVWDIITTERQRANTAEQSETTMRIQYDERDRQAAEYRTRTAEAQDRTAAAQERTANVLKEIPNREDANRQQKAIQDNNDQNTKAITAHVDEAVKPILEATETIIEAADNTLTTLQEVEKRLGQLATKAELTEQLQPLRESVERLREAIEHQLLPSLPPTTIDAPP